MMEYTIRMAHPEDAAAAAAIEAACFPAAEACGYEEFERRIKIFPDSFWIAEAEGRSIGFVNGCVTDAPHLPDELYHDASLHRPEGAYQTVFGLDVLPEYQRQGIAAALLGRMLADTRARGKKGAVLTCKDHLRHYYEKFGFQYRGVADSNHGGAVWNLMVLEFEEEAACGH